MNDQELCAAFNREAANPKYNNFPTFNLVTHDELSAYLRRMFPIWFPAFELDYTMSKKCPVCKAEPWADCNAPNLSQQENPEHRQHKPRISLGVKHYMRDLMKAPWWEQREFRSYSTVERP